MGLRFAATLENHNNSTAGLLRMNEGASPDMRPFKSSAEEKQDPAVQVIIQALSTIEGCPLSMPLKLVLLRMIVSWFSLSQPKD